MSVKLVELRTPNVDHEVEIAGHGFVIVRRTEADRDVFNDLVREVLADSGNDYVALPVTDGGDGYERVVIVPFDG